MTETSGTISIWVMLMPKSNVHEQSQQAHKRCSQPRKQARNCRKLPYNSVDKRFCQTLRGSIILRINVAQGKSLMVSRQPQKLLSVIEQLERSYHRTQWSIVCKLLLSRTISKLSGSNTKQNKWYWATGASGRSAGDEHESWGRGGDGGGSGRKPGGI